MNKASFSAQIWVNFNDVPIPEHLETADEVLDYLQENCLSEEFKKYRDENAEIWGKNEPEVNTATILNDDEEEFEISR